MIGTIRLQHERFKVWIKGRSLLLFNTVLTLMGLLLIIQAIILLDFLPTFIDRPVAFPIEATCLTVNKTVINNFCQINSEDISSGGVNSYWEACHLAEYQVIYETSNHFFEDYLIKGNCTFLFPKILAPEMMNELPKLNQTYDCWLNQPESQCFLIDLTEQNKVFIGLQTVLSIFWLIACIFLCYVHRENEESSLALVI